MKDRKRYYKALKEEILNDQTLQGYNDMLGREYKNPRDRFQKIAEKINLNRAKELGFPIVRSNIVRFIIGD